MYVAMYNLTSKGDAGCVGQIKYTTLPSDMRSLNASSLVNVMFLSCKRQIVASLYKFVRSSSWWTIPRQNYPTLTYFLQLSIFFHIGPKPNKPITPSPFHLIYCNYSAHEFSRNTGHFIIMLNNNKSTH